MRRAAASTGVAYVAGLVVGALSPYLGPYGGPALASAGAALAVAAGALLLRERRDRFPGLFAPATDRERRHMVN